MSASATPKSAPARRGWIPRVFRVLAGVALGLLLLLLTAWVVMALAIDVRLPALRRPLAIAYVLAILAIWIFVKRRWLATGLTVAARHATIILLVRVPCASMRLARGLLSG